MSSPAGGKEGPGRGPRAQEPLTWCVGQKWGCPGVVGAAQGSLEMPGVQWLMCRLRVQPACIWVTRESGSFLEDSYSGVQKALEETGEEQG